jgi:glutathione synthase/RimK-type ligase-like ATP-grasp enzyme
MLRVGLVTCADVPGLAKDDLLLVEELGRRDVATGAVVWNDPSADFSAFDCLLLRSCWDYHLQPGTFRTWLEARERSGSLLWNPPALVRRNMHKSYLRRLERAGIRIPPTAWLPEGHPVSLPGLLEQRGWTEAVVKPAVSACAFQTFLVRAETAAWDQERLDELLRAGDVLVQQFLPVIRREGEWSLVFFGGPPEVNSGGPDCSRSRCDRGGGGRYSHAVRKRPSGGDFRVQAHLGGTVQAEAPPPGVIRQAEAVAGRIPPPWVYARIDGVVVDGAFVLLEAELTEPVLFLGHDERAARRFADALLGQVHAHRRSLLGPRLDLHPAPVVLGHAPHDG